MFYRKENDYEGEGARLYRSTDEIRRDMLRISRSIDNANEMLNSRSILAEMMEAMALKEPGKFIPELEIIVEEAGATLRRLGELNESLNLLAKELSDTRWAEQP